jgi:hypothetical protein
MTSLRPIDFAAAALHNADNEWMTLKEVLEEGKDMELTLQTKSERKLTEILYASLHNSKFFEHKRKEKAKRSKFRLSKLGLKKIRESKLGLTKMTDKCEKEQLYDSTFDTIPALNYPIVFNTEIDCLFAFSTLNCFVGRTPEEIENDRAIKTTFEDVEYITEEYEAEHVDGIPESPVTIFTDEVADENVSRIFEKVIY